MRRKTLEDAECQHMEVIDLNHIISGFQSGPLIDAKVTLLGKNVDLMLSALIDTGASHSLVPLGMVEKLGLAKNISTQFMTVVVAGANHRAAIVGLVTLTGQLTTLDKTKVRLPPDSWW